MNRLSHAQEFPADRQIDVCICMHDRLSVLATLESLSLQRLPAGTSMRIIVADNNSLPLTRECLERAAAQLNLSLTHVHAPRDNISIARNACLATATADWVAFIDDDEVATPNWLNALLESSYGRDVVFGPVQALYSDDAPAWMIDSGFHATGITGNDRPDKGYSGNVLLRRAFVEAIKLRFDPALGRSGGEDTLFFRMMYAHGARFGYQPDALVFEEAGSDRARLGWLVQRRLRTGQIHLHLSSPSNGARRAVVVRACAKAAFCAAAAVATLPDRCSSNGWLLRAAFHCGVVSAWAGGRQIEDYGV